MKIMLFVLITLSLMFGSMPRAIAEFSGIRILSGKVASFDQATVKIRDQSGQLWQVRKDIFSPQINWRPESQVTLRALSSSFHKVKSISFRR